MEPSELLPGKVSFEITKVVTEMDHPDHFVVWVTVKNTSDFTWGFELFESFIG